MSSQELTEKFGIRPLFSSFLPLLMLSHFFHHLVSSLPVPLLPMMRNEFRLDYTQSGITYSAFSLAYGIAHIPAGWITDRIGPRIMITVGVSGVALAGLLIGVSQTYLMLIIFMALMGIFGGGYHPAAPQIVAGSINAEKEGGRWVSTLSVVVPVFSYRR